MAVMGPSQYKDDIFLGIWISIIKTRRSIYIERRSKILKLDTFFNSLNYMFKYDDICIYMYIFECLRSHQMNDNIFMHVEVYNN